MSEHHQDIEQAARTRLGCSGYAELNDIICEYKGDNRVLTLSGCVYSYYLKQRAQEVVRIVDGVARVDNLIEVADR